MYRDHGVIPKSSRDDNFNKPSDDLSTYRYVEPGDLVLNKMKTWQGSLAVSRFAGIVSPAYYVCSLTAEVEPRFIHYLLRSAPYIAMYGARSKGIRPNQWDLPYDEFKTVPVLLPPLDVQRRIADFLDDQVTRIDQAIGLRERQVELLSSEEKSLLDKILAASDEERLLAQLADSQRRIQYGIVLPGPDFPGGVPIVKGGDVAAGRMSPEELNRTDPAIESGYPRSRLIAGDIVIAIRGSVGEVAVVPETLEGANITQDAARIAPHGCDPTWLRWVLATPTVQGRIRREITGATVTGINIGALRRIRIPFVPLDEQIQRGRAATELAGRSQRLQALATRSKHLLLERKRSLITAAVTGEFDVFTASSRASGVVMDGVGG